MVKLIDACQTKLKSFIDQQAVIHGTEAVRWGLIGGMRPRKALVFVFTDEQQVYRGADFITASKVSYPILGTIRDGEPVMDWESEDAKTYFDSTGRKFIDDEQVVHFSKRTEKAEAKYLRNNVRKSAKRQREKERKRKAKEGVTDIVDTQEREGSAAVLTDSEREGDWQNLESQRPSTPASTPVNRPNASTTEPPKTYSTVAATSLGPDRASSTPDEAIAAAPSTSEKMTCTPAKSTPEPALASTETRSSAAHQVLASCSKRRESCGKERDKQPPTVLKIVSKSKDKVPTPAQDSTQTKSKEDKKLLANAVKGEKMASMIFGQAGRGTGAQATAKEQKKRMNIVFGSMCSLNEQN